jgi:hypothetical protein
MLLENIISAFGSSSHPNLALRPCLVHALDLEKTEELLGHANPSAASSEEEDTMLREG